MQVNKAARGNSDVFFYDLAHRLPSAARLARHPGVPSAAATLGFPTTAALQAAAASHPELVPLLSEFCLTPSGDTPTRRGFVEALLLGCVPVVFHDLTRSAYPWYLSPAEVNETTVLLDADSLGGGRMALLEPRLRRLKPRLPAMRAAIARVATRLQWATADLTEAEHAALGPDALDVALWGISTSQPRSQPQPQPRSSDAH